MTRASCCSAWKNVQSIRFVIEWVKLHLLKDPFNMDHAFILYSVSVLMVDNSLKNQIESSDFFQYAQYQKIVVKTFEQTVWTW